MPRPVALITGGGTGLGRASAIALARAGFDIALAGRRPQPLQEVAEEIGEFGVAAIAISANIVDPAGVAYVFDTIRDRFERLDLLFNNAGLSAPSVPIDELDIATWKAVIDVNLTGAFLCTQHAVRQFKSQQPQGGRIINNGSLSAHVPRNNSAPYTASKHAIWGLTKSTSLDGRPYGIACGQIDIGNAATAMNPAGDIRHLQPNGATLAEPMIAPELVADAVVYMAGLPLSANVLSMTVMATNMPYVGRG